MLAGRLFKAQLYDRALSAEQIAASAASEPMHVSQKAILESLSDQERSKVARLTQEINKLESLVQSLRNSPADQDDVASWSESAQAVFTLKEFIYVR